MPRRAASGLEQNSSGSADRGSVGSADSSTFRRAESADGESMVYSVEKHPVDLGNWTFLYESRDWRRVPCVVRGFGFYGSRNAGLRMLSNTHLWNSERYKMMKVASVTCERILNPAVQFGH